jgi:SAM-dependent methyltransferase
VSEKHPYPTGQFDTVICTQVLQYVDDPVTALEHMRYHLRDGGWLLLTGPTNWPVVEDTDKWRFTLHGAVLILLRAGFRNTTVEPRADVKFEGERWSLGWQASGQAL